MKLDNKTVASGTVKSRSIIPCEFCSFCISKFRIGYCVEPYVDACNELDEQRHGGEPLTFFRIIK